MGRVSIHQGWNFHWAGDTLQWIINILLDCWLTCMFHREAPCEQQEWALDMLWIICVSCMFLCWSSCDFEWTVRPAPMGSNNAYIYMISLAWLHHDQWTKYTSLGSRFNKKTEIWDRMHFKGLVPALAPCPTIDFFRRRQKTRPSHKRITWIISATNKIEWR